MVVTCDYLVLGAGAQGIAFTDALLAEGPAARVVIADMRSSPGGMWNDTYAFAKLDQPNIFFGLSSSVRLEGAQPDWGGGPSELASQSEVLTYFETCMTHLVKKHSVLYFPNYVAEVETGWPHTQARLMSTISAGNTIDVIVHKKVVDSGYGSVPASLSPRTFPFEVDPAAEVVRPHELGKAHAPMCAYVVIGAGKTGLDTVLWLLSRHVPAEKVRWVVPRDSWYFVAEEMEQERVINNHRVADKCAATSESAEDFYLKMEEAGKVCRIDKQHFPEICHCIWLPRADLASLRAVPAIRLGHVRKVATDRLLLEHGSAAIPKGSLCIDCTGSGRRAQEVAPIFSASTIKLQRVAEFSAGYSEMSAPFCAVALGFLEAKYPDDTHMKNSLCTPAPFPDHYIDWIKYLFLFEKGRQEMSDRRVASFLWSHPSSRYHKIVGGEQLREFASLNQTSWADWTHLGKIASAVGFSRLQGKSDSPAYDAPTSENDEAKGASCESGGAAPGGGGAEGASWGSDGAAIREQLARLVAGQEQLGRDVRSVVAENRELRQLAAVAGAGR